MKKIRYYADDTLYYSDMKPVIIGVLKGCGVDIFIVYRALTLCCYIFYFHPMFVSHISKHREDGKPWEETGDAVYSAGQESIP